MIVDGAIDAYNLSNPFIIFGKLLSDFDDVVMGGDGGGDK